MAELSSSRKRVRSRSIRVLLTVGALAMLAAWFLGYNEVAGAALVTGVALILAAGVVSLSVRGIATSVVIFVAMLCFPPALNAAFILTGNDPDPGGAKVVTPQPALRDR